MDPQKVQKIFEKEFVENENYLKTANFVMQKILLDLNLVERREKVLTEKMEQIKKEIKIKNINEIINNIS